MVKANAIKPLSDFLRNSKSHIQSLQSSQEPEILTVNGEAAVVIQDAASYEKIAELAQQAIEDAKLQSALQYFRDGGEGIAHDNVFANLEKKYT